MSYLKEKVSYLKGLSDGMKLDDSSNEGKLLKAIIEALNDIVVAVDDIEEVQEQLIEQVDIIDDDLADVEKVIFDEEDDDDEDDEECDDDAEVECPFCNKVFEIDDELISDEDETIECPYCHEKIDIDWECSCGCDHSEDEE